MASPKTYFVRVRPHNKKRGCLVRNYMHRGVRFTTRWKEVSATMAEELRRVVQPHDPAEQIPLFDIKTKDEAAAIEQQMRDELGPKLTPKVKDAERIPDRKFRDDKPQLDEDTGEITDDHVESAEEVEVEPEPAPSMRSSDKPKQRARARM